MTKLEDKKYFQLLTEKVLQITNCPVRLMEVCGTHTMAIGKTGIRSVLPEQVELLSGPGCPVCVTADGDIDAFMDLAQQKDVVFTTYGDMMRVPGSHGSLAELKAGGADIRVVYSSLEALQIARREKEKEVVFLGVGFETTTPATAHAVITAEKEKLANFSVYNIHKTVPPALKVLLDDEETHIDGFILPGHVSVVIGEKPYLFLAEDYGVSGVIVGFEPPEIMAGILRLVQDIQAGTPRISNLYPKVVRPEGNLAALKLITQIFTVGDAEWRGIGVIPNSALDFSEKYAAFDAAKKFAIERKNIKLHPGCSCGEILKGRMKPSECLLFSKKCTPEYPVGPCMVSSEGTCSAYYLYGGGKIDE